EVRALELDPAFDARLGEVAPCCVERLRLRVAAVNGGRVLAAPRLLLDALPQPGVESRELFERKAPLRARRAAARHGGGFDKERAAAAHGIEQRLLGLPAGEHDDPRSQVLAQRGFRGAGAPAAFE